MLQVLRASGRSAEWKDENSAVTVRIGEAAEGDAVRLCWDFDADGDEYVLLPACCYNGNRFASLKKEYPPMFTPEEAGVDLPVTITDVIRLNPDGSGRIEATSGDVSTPCIGVYSAQKQRAMLLFTIQEIGGVNLGLAYEKGRMELQYPHFRQNGLYRSMMMREGKDPGMDFEAGQEFTIPYRLLDFACGSMEQFYEVYFRSRKCMGMDSRRPAVIPFAEQFAIQRDKYNHWNWWNTEQYYRVGTGDNMFNAWQLGWVGGGMISYPMMKLGGELEWERGMATLQHMARTQRASGLLCGIVTTAGEEPGDGFRTPGTENWVLIRKCADALYFLFKHFALIKERGKEIPAELTDMARKLADAFVKLWETYGQLGQFADVVTGEIAVGGSTSGGIAPAGLVEAYRFFREEKYLTAAEKIGAQYYERDAAKGYTTGGPGEILQGADSESCFGLLESMVSLYDETREEKWLERAKHLAHLCSSWVVSYNYRFPEESEFGKKDMKTVGSVFANIQNKHSAPGICTLSGDGLYKLWKWTGDEAYLELLRDISLTISQYMSRPDRPICSPYGDKMPQGYICERVNLSDWEGEEGVGSNIFGSCWCECSNLLTLAEVADLPGVADGTEFIRR